MAKIKVFEPNPDDLPTPKTRKTHFSSKDKPPLFDELFACQWRGIGFPIESMRIQLDQDLVEHKYWGVDSASVESTGRNPVQIEAVIPFVNGIVPGKAERWGTLFPDTFILFLEAMNDRTTGILDTPQIAGLTCKPVSIEYSYEADIRNGVRATARWVETIDEDLASNVNLATFTEAYISALNLDAAIAAQKDFENPVSDISFDQLVNELAGVIDTGASRISLLLNKPAQIRNRLNKVRDSLERAPNVMLWPLKEAAEDLKAVLQPLVGSSTVVGTGPSVAEAQRQPARRIERYITHARTTLASLQAKFSNNSVDDLMYLNPRLLSRPAVPSNTVIRYYA